jgi:hypothetical protein
MKVTFGVGLKGLWKIPQMSVLSLLFNHYLLAAASAMRPIRHSAVTVYNLVA